VEPWEKIFASECNQEQVEATLRGRITELEETLAASEGERKEATLRGLITELEEKLEIGMEQVEHRFVGQIENMERKREETEATLCFEIYKLSTEHEEKK
jgi:hypothetical protein